MILDQLYAFVVDHWQVLVIVVSLTWLFRNKYGYGVNKYPGPFLAGFTDWWRFYDVLGRDPQHTHIDLHRKYGDVVRLGPNVLSFADPLALKDIYGPVNKGFVKTQFYPVQNTTRNGRRVKSLFSTVAEDYHARLKRCVNHAYSMSTLVGYEPLVNTTITTFLDQTQKLYCNPGKACEFSKWLQFFAFDVIGQISFGKRFGFVDENKDVDGIISFIANFLNYAAPVGQQPWIDYLFMDKNPVKMALARIGLWNNSSAIATFANKRIEELREDLEGVKTGKIDIEQIAAKGKGVSFLTRFKRAQYDHPEFMDDFTVLASTVSLVFAGSDTTASALSANFYHLLRNPRCYGKLMQEIDAGVEDGTVVPSDSGLISWADSQKLPYLDACIQETFRCFPSIGLLLERHVPQGGAQIGKHQIPGGTIVGCNAWVIHRRKDVFGDDVEAFRPERWLEASPEKLKEMKGVMFQFGMGPRTCIGKNISLLEIYKLLPSFLRRFEIEFVDSEKDWRTLNVWFVRQVDFHVRFKLRDASRESG